MSRVDVLAIFSGNCLKGVCGEPAGFTDMAGSPLHVGDIVLTFTVFQQDGECLDYFPDGLSAVVSDEWASYSDGSFVRKDDARQPFVMGIASVPMDAPGQWRVRLVKSHKDVIAGEHWTDYGFSYRPAPDAALARIGGDA